jgi:hypothetical protein
VLKVSTDSTIKELKTECLKKIQEFKAFKTHPFDTMKVYVKQHGSKTSNLIINLDSDEFLNDDQTVSQSGIGNEDEISFFNINEYNIFKEDPQVKW